MVQQQLPLTLLSTGFALPLLFTGYALPLPYPTTLLSTGFRPASVVYGFPPAPTHHPPEVEYFLANVGIALVAFTIWLLVGLEAN